MNNAVSTGAHFGLMSGVITTLGLMVGLNSGTHSTLAVIGGIITIAVADAMSDALGVHVAKEAEPQHSTAQVWLATVTTLFTKFIMALTFVVPVLLLPLQHAMVASVIWGLCVVAALSVLLARTRQVAAWPVIMEHVGIAMAVVLISHLLGDWVKATFS